MSIPDDQVAHRKTIEDFDPLAIAAARPQAPGVRDGTSRLLLYDEDRRISLAT